MNPTSTWTEQRRSHVRPLYVPAPCQDAPGAGRLILRDGTTATIRVARCEDQEALRLFFEKLSPEARWRRFFSASLPPKDMIESLCDAADPHIQLALIVTRLEEGAERIIATASYHTVKDKVAEAAFAVDDA